MSLVNKARYTALSSTDQAVKTSRGVVQWLDVFNPNAAEVMHIHLYDAATGDVTVGTTTPGWTYAVPATSRAVIPVAGYFGTAITIAATQDDNSTAPTTGGVVMVKFD